MKLRLVGVPVLDSPTYLIARLRHLWLQKEGQITGQGPQKVTDLLLKRLFQMLVWSFGSHLFNCDELSPFISFNMC